MMRVDPNDKKLSPMMRQYLLTKQKYNDAILFFRLGDFYEMFFEDAELCARILELTLTGKDCGLEKRAPMCGVPHHACEGYVAKLVDNGYKVAICEQLTLPEKGVKVVERDVVRIITPGTLMESSMLDETKNNYIASIFKQKDCVGISAIDISTGKFIATEFLENNILTKANDFLVSIKPSEVIVNAEMQSFYDSLMSVQSGYLPKCELLGDEYFDYKEAQVTLKNQLKLETLSKLGINNRQFAISSAGAILKYIFETQKRQLSHINSIEFVNTENYMQLDANTRKNLELTETIKDRKKRGTLFWVLNKTKTSMGARLLKSYIEQPLYNEKSIINRLNSVEELVKNIVIREKLSEILYDIYDIERLVGRISYNNLVTADCILLKKSLSLVPEVKNALEKFSASNLMRIKDNLFDFSDIVELLDKSIVDKNDDSRDKRDGEIIKYGFNKELDEYMDISKSTKDIIAKLEAKEKEETKIKNLKIGYNKDFGYYIEVPNYQKDMVPYR